MLLLLSAFSGYSQNFNKEVEPIINIQEKASDFFTITASAKNLTQLALSLSYEFSVIKKGVNNSANKQSNFFSLQASEIKSLASTSISQDDSTEIVILLIFKDDNEKIISTNRKLIKSNEKETAKEEISYHKRNEGIKLTGFVTENIKTKPGKDFYDFFYQQYMLSELESEHMISVDEIISFGRTTRLSVKVEGRVVYQFFARPKLDYLRENADKALNEVSRYLQYMENRNEYTNQY
ncbi:CsgE family curli-type amyloid fiber assembly protein [Christiangramia marina]|uniref:CsgE family curli-type amyloid fiber assembly protein n=1 Tax=Christiangramia marina TaxID=409436 RepID=UPI003AA8D6AC